MKLCVLYSSLLNTDWPDSLDLTSGILTYYGDNKHPGRGLHDTTRKGNIILRHVFNSLHNGLWRSIPPFFIFTKGPKGRDVIFRGLAVPGADTVNQTEDLVAIWKTKNGKRFQNYKAIFTILDCPLIKRSWINDLHAGKNLTDNTPGSWRIWVNKKKYKALTSPRSIDYRKKAEQIPTDQYKLEIINTIIEYFKHHDDREYAFEKCAKEIMFLADSNIFEIDLTRPWRDGGRDGIGLYKIGLPETSIAVEFALEAKCKGLNSGVGVRETSRLISRLRHRQFGIVVTTSYVNEQAYKEIVEDQHPVLVISAIDIVNILVSSGFSNAQVVKAWLASKF